MAAEDARAARAPTMVKVVVCIFPILCGFSENRFGLKMELCSCESNLVGKKEGVEEHKVRMKNLYALQRCLPRKILFAYC